MIEKSPPQFAELLGEAIVALSYHLCGVSPDAHVPAGGVVQGFDKLAPIYVETTEHRDGPGPPQRKHYSSCGDQLHAILERVGVRLPFVNRASLKQYVVGANIARLQRPACPFAAEPPKDPSWRPAPGTLGLIWTTGYDAHALVFLGLGSDDHHIRTGNYGAGGMSEATAPGANVADSPCVPEIDAHGKQTGYLLIGSSRRRLHSIITPAAIVPFIDAQINLSGCPVSGDLVTALGARYD